MSIEFRLVESFSKNPYFNLAAEKLMTENDDKAVLFLWQNAPTVVIGYNQNPFSECNLEKMQNSNVFLARRSTGGGAVFHDYGNLNFSFAMPSELYDVNRQCKVIVDALSTFGVKAEISGRNDILFDGKKFSGNAYYNGKKRKLHHGTLMIKVDFNALSNYLTPDPIKFIKKGVSSVRSRVVNLSEINESINVERLKSALFSAFKHEYDLEDAIVVEKLSDSDIQVIELAKEISSNEYLYKKWDNFAQTVSADFNWGTVKACVKTHNGKITSVTFATDGLYPEAVEYAENYFNSLHNGNLTKPLLFPDFFSDDGKKVTLDLIHMIEI